MGDGRAAGQRERSGRATAAEPLVLLVEDDPRVAAVVLRMLAPLRLRCVCAADAESALAVLHAGALPDAVVSDHQLRGATGLELVQRIRRAWPELPLILHTADQGALAAARAAGIRVIEKGCPRDVLCGAVRELLGRGGSR